tara:strand:+ start:542 stop:1318 length:777 start_codon:yes stop_codon:yes gene_type:complete
MFRPRLIPVLLLKNKGLVKSVKFKNHNYIGDPINAVKMFNDFNADEIVFLDISATKEKRTIPIDFVKNVGEEANMPFGVGGGISSLKDIEKIIKSGSEKVIISSKAIDSPEFIKSASENFGSSTICVCVDIKKNIFGNWKVYYKNGKKSSSFSPIDLVKIIEDNGAGEIIIQSINHDGLMNGYDLNLLNSISKTVSIPVVALGGAGSLDDCVECYKNSYVSALAAGSIFVYQGSRKGVLINYPSNKEKSSLLNINKNI